MGVCIRSMWAMNVRRIGALVTVQLLLTDVQAADWITKAEAGLVSARGNTHTDTSNAKFDVARSMGRWKNSLGLSGVYAADETGAISQRWDARAQTEFTFDTRSFTFASVRYEDDRFSGFEYQTTYAAGFGRRFIDTDRTKLSAQLGVGYKVFETQASVSDGVVIPSERGEDPVAQSVVEYEQALTDNTRVRNKLLTEWGPENSSVQNDLALQINMTRVLALAIGYSVRYNTQPPDGFNTTDTLSTVNLVFELK